MSFHQTFSYSILKATRENVKILYTVKSQYHHK